MHATATRFPLLFVAFLAVGAVPALADERLLVPEMPGWKIVSQHTDGVADVRETIPAAETPDTWTDRLSIQAFRGVPMTAKDFLDGLEAQMAPVCDKVAAEPLRPIAMEGAEAGRRGIACGRFKGDGQGNYTLYYAIRGRRALYVLARGWRGAPFDVATPPVPASTLADWNAEFDAVRLCDTSDPSRPCR